MLTMDVMETGYKKISCRDGETVSSIVVVGGGGREGRGGGGGAVVCEEKLS